VILPWERQGRDVSGGDQPRAAEARLAEAIGLAGSIGLVVTYEVILPLRVRRPSTLFGEGQVESQRQAISLNHVRKSKTPVTVFLVNGVKLQGIITWFDNFSVLLRRDGHTQLVYKHAISTVMPGAPIQLFDAAKSEGAATAPAREMSGVTGDD